MKLMQLFAVFLCLGTNAICVALAPDFYLGSWGAGGEAAMSIIGDLQIEAAHIKWSGSRSSPRCRTTYTVVERTTGTTKYPDEGWPESDVPNDIPFDTVKIRLGNAKCLEGIAYMRLAMRADNLDHLDVVPYNSANKPAGWFNFGRE